MIYLIALSRPPSGEELRLGRGALARLVEQWAATGQPAPEQKALASYCHTITNSAALLYID